VIEKIESQDPEAGVAGATVLILDGEADSSHAALVGLSLKELLTRDRIRIIRPDSRPDPAEISTKPISCAIILDKKAPGFTSEMDFPVIHAEEFERHAAKQTAAASPLAGHEVAAVYTGVVPIVYKAQRTLLNSLIASTFWSFVTITPIMMFVSRSIWAGSVVMLPNVLPVLVVFGGMGWLGISVDIGSMMSASIALGVAVDDTIHFLSWFRGDLRNSPDRKSAILVAYRRCATPTLQAALISGMGLSVFAFSTFTPTQRFGWLMLTILMAGVVAELIMLPAILAGPLGRVFQVRGTPRSVEFDRPADVVPASHLDRKRQYSPD
jgi:hypothetical protein